MGATCSTILTQPASIDKNELIADQINAFSTKHEFIHAYSNYEEVSVRIRFMGQILPKEYPDRIETILEYIGHNCAQTQWVTKEVIKTLIQSVRYPVDLTQNMLCQADWH